MKKIIMAGAALLAAGVVQAQVVVGLDFVDTANSGAVSSLGAGTVTLSTDETDLSLVMGTVVSASQQLGAVTLTDGGYSGVYHLSVDVASTGTGDTEVGRGGSGTMSPGGNLMQAGEQLTYSNVKLTYVSGDDAFKFDGFTGVRIGNLGGTETVTANEITIVDGDAGEGSGSSFTPTAAFELADTAVITSTSGGMSVNVVDAQFSLLGDSYLIASISASPTSGEAPLEVEFDGSESKSSGTITDYNWDFGDGNSDSGVAVTHTYADAGEYTATLIVLDDEGKSATNTVSISPYVILDPEISVSEAGLDFGDTYLGFTNSLSVTVENVGGQVLDGTASVSAPFYIESGGTYSLSEGQQQVVTVLFVPEAVGGFTNTLSFTGGSGTNITVIGTGAVQPTNAVISWAGYESTASSNEVVNTGTTILAINADPSSTGTFTVNGVEFENSNAYLGMGAGNYFTSLTSSDPGYQELIESTDYDNNTLIQTITLTDLQEGQDYLIQYWYMANTGTTRTMTLTASGRSDTGDGDLTLTAVDEGADLQYAVGTFTALGDTQDFTFIASANGVRLTAFQLRQLTFSATDPVVLSVGSDATGSNILVNWNSESNLYYAVQSRDSLLTDDWSTVSSNIPATPPMNTYTGEISEATGFYQVIVE